MMTNIKNKHTHFYWVVVAFIAILLGAPNAMVIRILLESTDNWSVIFLRFAMLFVVTLPFLIWHSKKLVNKAAFKNTALAALWVVTGTVSYTLAIEQSQASYMAIIGLVAPVLLVVFSARIFKERITHRTLLGIVVAVAGALILAVSPIIIGGANIQFYPLATVYGLFNTVTFALMVIYMRKSNESGVPMTAVIAFCAAVVMVVALAIALLFSNKAGISIPQEPGFWAVLAYSSIGIMLFSRMFNVLSFRHIGAGLTSGLTYLESFFAIILPVIVLNETLSSTMIFGGIVIMIGVYIIESHPKTHKHIRHLRHMHVHGISRH